jgi:hypothetical protein
MMNESMPYTQQKEGGAVSGGRRRKMMGGGKRRGNKQDEGKGRKLKMETWGLFSLSLVMNNSLSLYLFCLCFLR